MSQTHHKNSTNHKGIIAWFAQNSVAANLLLLGVIALGLLSLNNLRKEAFPSMEPDSIRVSVVYDSGDAKQAEEGIAIKIEEALETVAGVKRITSTSNANGSSVNIEKLSGYDLNTLLTDVKTNVDAIYNFPADAEKPVITKARRQDHAIWVQLYGDADRATLQSLAERLKVDLLGKPGISDLEIKAKAESMLSVEVDENKLLAYGLTLSDISDAINQESSTSLTTSLRNGEKVIRLKSAEQAYRKTEFDAIPIVTNERGSIIRLGEIAKVSDTFADDTFVMSRYNGQNGIGIEIVMDEYSDVTRIVKESQEVVEDWHSRNLLPENVGLVTWYDKSTLIKERLSLLISNALTGIAFVFIILALFLNVRVAFWVAAGLPFVFCGTLYFMTDTFMGLTINEMTTFGFIMALGIVVDDAVVIGESIYATRQQEGDTIDSTIKGTMRVAVPTFFGVLTTVVAFVSLTQVEGPLGQIYAQFGSIVTICLLLSIIESKLILPAHMAHLNTHRKATHSWRDGFAYIQDLADQSLQFINKRIYTPSIKVALQFRYAVVLTFIALLVLVIGMPMTGSVRVSFFPDIVGDVVVSSISMQKDAAFGQTYQNLQRLEEAVIQADRQLMDDNKVSGTGITSLQVTADEDLSGKVIVEISSESPYSTDELKDLWQANIGLPEGAKKVKFLAKMEMGEDFKVELKGWDQDNLKAAGERLKSALQNTPGVSGIDDNLTQGQPQLRFQLNEQGRSLGMNTATLSQQLLQSFGGDVVQRYQRDKDEIKVRVRYPENHRQSYADIMEANVRTPSGVVLPLSAIVSIKSDNQIDEVTRIDGQRAIYLTAVVDKHIISSNDLVNQLEDTLVPELRKQYADLNIHFAGEAEKQSEATGSMADMFIIALLVIYVLIAIPLRSYTQPLIIMSVIPFGIVGAILGHWANDLTISILSLNGILALSGVVINDSLLLVSRFNELRTKGIPLIEAVVEACTSRLRAVLLTSITTFAGLMPLLSETSMQAQFLIPAAASLGYGILFATLITLTLIPSLLVIQQDIKLLPTNISNIIARKFKRIEA